MSQVGQEFTPVAPILAAVDVRVEAGNPGDILTVNIRKGTITSPILASTSRPISSPFPTFQSSDSSAGWLHVDFPAPLAITPGDKYVLELLVDLPGSLGVNFSNDLYPGGCLIGVLSCTQDLAFRTYGPEGPLPAGTFLLKFAPGFGPVDVAVDGSGDIIVVAEDNTVKKFDSSGKLLLKFGSLCTLVTGSGCIDPDGAGPLKLGDGQFRIGEAGVAVDNSGNIYVADQGNRRVQKFDSLGNFLFQIGSGAISDADGDFAGPSGIAVDSSRNIYVTGQSNHRVQKFDSEGNFLLKFGCPCTLATGIGCIDPDGEGPLELGDGQFGVLVGIAVDSFGNIIVPGATNNRVQVFDTFGNFKFKFGTSCNIATGSGCTDPDGAGPLELGDGQFNNPHGVAVDSEDNIFVSEVDNDRVQKFDSNGNFLLKFGSSGFGDGQFISPRVLDRDSLAQIHRRDDYAAAERAIGAREGDGPE